MSFLCHGFIVCPINELLVESWQCLSFRFHFEPKSRFELKYFCVHMIHLGPHRDCLNFATNPNLISTSIVVNMLLRMFYVTAALKADITIESVNKMWGTSQAQFYFNISKQPQITFSFRTETVFMFTWDFDEVLNLPPNFVSVYQTELKFKTNSSFVSVCHHVNRHRRDTSKWSEISLRIEIWLRSEILDIPHVNAALK